MCWTCGGRCELCGEASTTVLRVSSCESYLACDEHADQMEVTLRHVMQMREAAPLN